MCCCAGKQKFDEERLQRIDSALQSYIDNGWLPQAVTMVMYDGKVVHNKAYGYRRLSDSTACEVTDLFRLASQTKAVTAVALMTLWEEGRFLLDEPISRYIPEFANPQVLESYDSETGEYTTRAATREITIRHLITHTSGLCYDGFFSDICKSKGVAEHRSPERLTIEENVRRIATLPLKHDPGEQFTYCFNTDVLGRLIEILSGEDYVDFVRERIFVPLKMNDTYFYIGEDECERLVELTPSEEYPASWYMAGTYPSPSAGLVGSIGDYARFCQMVLNGGELDGRRVIGRKTLEMMERNGVGQMRGEIGFGMAWDVFTPENGHNTVLSEGSMRWGGMFGTDYVIDPKEKIVMLLYTNCYPNHSGKDAKTLLHNVVYQAIEN